MANQNYYIWNNRGQAEASLNFINNQAMFPFENSVRGVKRADVQKTERWASEVREFKNNKWGFPVLPDGSKYPHYSAVRNERAAQPNQPTIEEYDPAWELDRDPITGDIIRGNGNRGNGNGGRP